MSSFRYDGMEIAYLDTGKGDPIVLVHGYASNKEVNWVGPSWVTALSEAGHRVLALDLRGHGQSTKFYDSNAYSLTHMAGDVIALLDHVGIQRTDLLGYSMGGRVVGSLAATRGDRVRSVIIGGIGIRLVESVSSGPGHPIAEAMEAPGLDAISNPFARNFRAFAEQTKSDLKALAACARYPTRTLTPAQASAICAPTLIATGTRDDIAGPAKPLLELIPHAEILDIPGRDHMRAVGDPAFKQGVLDFLKRRP